MSNTKKATLKEKLCHTLDIQPDLFPNETHVEMRGRNCVTIKGGGCITVYTDKEVRLAVKGGSICVRGDRLCCLSYCKGAVVVDGSVRSVSFEEDSK